jgi:hypothetical protein
VQHPDRVFRAVHIHAPRLLQWLAEVTTGRQDTPVPLEEFRREHRLLDLDIAPIVGHCEERGWLRAFEDQDGETAAVLLACGAEAASRMWEELANTAVVARYTQDAVLRWCPAQGQPGNIAAFRREAHSYFHGRQLSPHEVGGALGYLARHGLVTCTGVDFHGAGGSMVELTDDGLACLQHGQSVADHLRDLRRARETDPAKLIQNTFNGPVHQPQIGDSPIQHNQISNFAPAQDLPDLLRLLGPGLGLTADNLTELRRAADELTVLQRADEPDPAGWRRVVGALGRALRTAPDSMGAQLLLSLTQRGLDDVGQFLPRH